MSKLSRREVMLAAAATAACGGADMPFIPRKLPPSAVPRLRPPYNQNPVYHGLPAASPIHLSSSIVLASGAAGTVPVAALKNPMGADMEILEIKFEVSGLYPPINSVRGVAFGGTVSCALSLGGYELTNGSIPVWGFGRAENLSAENKVNNPSDTALSRNWSAYTWRLPRPLYVPADAVVLPNFVHTGFITEALNVRIGYSARSVFVKPKTVCLPWVAQYTSKAFNPIETAGTDQSAELDLVNDTDKTFRLQRFTGRTLYIDPAGNASEDSPQSFGSQQLTMRMVDSYGRPLVRNFTPFRSVFGALTRSWELENVGAELDPGAYYRVFLKNGSVTPATPGAQGQAFVTMVGWREEANS